MNTSGKIEIQEYSGEWVSGFHALKAVYESCLGDMIIAAHHVGSTSVPGLPAKPIIDIDLVIATDEMFAPVIKKLCALGYDHVGDLGIDGREMFKRNAEEIPDDGSGRKWPQHHLYVCHKDNLALQNHLLFRDFLRENPGKVKEYALLKRKLAEKYAFDIDGYVREKTKFVIDGLRAKGVAEEMLQRIVAQNKAIGR